MDNEILLNGNESFFERIPYMNYHLEQQCEVLGHSNKILVKKGDSSNEYAWQRTIIGKSVDL